MNWFASSLTSAAGLANTAATVLAAETSEALEAVTASGWFLENAWLIPILPGLSFLAILFFGKRFPKRGSEIGILAVGASCVLAMAAAVQWILAVNSAGKESSASAVVRTWTWWQNGGFNFTVGTLVDGLTVTLLVVVTLVSLLVHIFSTDYLSDDSRYTHFFAFLSFFTASMLFFVLSENTLQMIVGWELVGVCSFVLIGHWWEERPNSTAALKAMLTNRVGDIGLLVGVSILFFAAGETFSVLELNERAISGDIAHLPLLVGACALLAAVLSKSGQFFLHTWLPDAMAGPTPVSALIHAATMVVAGVYLIARLYGVFFEGFSIAGSSINLLALIGGITTLVGASLAFVQRDIKRVLAYSTISQLGYMVLALGVGAWTAAVFHLFTHAFFKACLFLGSGSVSHAVHSFDMKSDMGGLRKFMPQTYRTFLLASLALAGLPPLAGFWSKDEILAGTGGWGLFGGTGGNGAYLAMLIMGLVTAALTAAYMTRCVYLTFFGEFRGHGQPHESGPRIVAPLWILAVLAVGAGVLNLPPGFQLVPNGWTERFGHFVEPGEAVSYFPKIDHATPSWTLAVLSALVALAGIIWAARYYFGKVAAHSRSATELPDGPVAKSRLGAAGHTLLTNKYYLDHLYTKIIAGGVKGPIAKAAYRFNQEGIDKLVNEVGERAVQAGHFTYDVIDQKVVDGLVNTSGVTPNMAGEELRRMQTGKVQTYAGIVFIAAALLALGFIVFL